MSVVHGTFTIRREYGAPVAIVSKAWADKDAKARWFAAPVECTGVIREQDFCVGGRDRLKAAWHCGCVTDFRAEYRDIVENERIVYVHDMHVDAKSLATLEFAKVGKGTKLAVTEQGLFLDGCDDAGSHERGTSDLLDGLGRSLRT